MVNRLVVGEIRLGVLCRVDNQIGFAQHFNLIMRPHRLDVGGVVEDPERVFEYRTCKNPVGVLRTDRQFIFYIQVQTFF